MANTLFDVKATVRSIIGDDDPNGWLKDSYLVPKINYAYRNRTLYIKNATGMNLEKMVEIPAEIPQLVLQTSQAAGEVDGVCATTYTYAGANLQAKLPNGTPVLVNGKALTVLIAGPNSITVQSVGTAPACPVQVNPVAAVGSIIVPSIPEANGISTTQGLTTLAAYQQPGKLLDGLYEPLFLWWKPAGASQLAYREMKERKTILPGQSIGNQVPTSSWWGNNVAFTWRGSQLFITPVSFPIDICVDGRFNPPPLVKDEDVLVSDSDMEVCVTPYTISVIGVESGNAGYQASVGEAELAADNIVAKLIRQKQGYTARAGSNSRMSRGCGWSWW